MEGVTGYDGSTGQNGHSKYRAEVGKDLLDCSGIGEQRGFLTSEEIFEMPLTRLSTMTELSSGGSLRVGTVGGWSTRLGIAPYAPDTRISRFAVLTHQDQTA